MAKLVELLAICTVILVVILFLQHESTSDSLKMLKTLEVQTVPVESVNEHDNISTDAEVLTEFDANKTITTDKAPAEDKSEAVYEDAKDIELYYQGDRTFKTINISKQKRTDLLSFMQKDGQISDQESKQNFVIKSFLFDEKFVDYKFKSASCKEHLCHFEVTYIGSEDGRLARSYLTKLISEYQINFSVSAVSVFSIDNKNIDYDVFFQPRIH